MMTYEQWLESILSSVRNIASRDFQERSWLGKGPEVSSPEEVYNELFGDFTYDLFFEMYSQNLTKDQKEAWKDLKSHLEEYWTQMPDRLPPQDVLDDPKWQLVREAASRFLTAFGQTLA